LFQNKSHIFFDLDHTLWDYNRNCEETLFEIYESFQLQTLGIETSQILTNQFHIENDRLWQLYDSRQISADELRFRRFRDIFTAFGIKDLSICDSLHETYMAISPNKPHLMEGTLEILKYLKPKYQLHIITNGIVDNQSKKMKAAGIDGYFKNVICSQKANARKPEKAIFEYALNISQTTAEQAIMIGDNYEVDIVGAINAGMDAIHFCNDEKKQINYDKTMIKHLLELKQIL
jgi:YjjG family noncanonical pyrimidine nucleotidase